MRSLFRSRIFRRQFLSFFGLTLLFFGSIGLALLLRTSRAIIDRQMEVSAAYRDQISQRLLGWLGERRSDVQYLEVELADEGAAALQRPVAEQRLSAFMEVATGIRSVIVIDSRGMVVASSSGPAYVGRAIGDRDYARAAIAGHNYTSPIFKGLVSGEEDIAIAAPLRIVGGDHGAVVAYVPIVELSRILESSSLENLGRAFFVDKEGRSVFAASGAGAAAEEKGLPASLLKAGEGVSEYRKADGTRVIGAYQWLDSLNLGLAVELSRALALRPVAALFGFTATLAVVMLALLVILSYILSAIIIEPISALLEGAEALRLGQASAPIRVKTGTELDQLAELFNSMAGSVREREEHLRESASRDSLTKLYNHGRFEEFLDLEIRRRRRADELVSLVMLDIDHFKQINDRYGHLAGDEVLRGIAEILVDTVRGGDIVARYGGEEFAIILDAASEEEVVSFCERVRTLVESASFIEAGEAVAVTASLGWTRCPARGNENSDIVRRADRALYDAKNAGRNRVRGSSG